MSVKRYRHYIDPDTHCFCEMESITDGAYVTYEDYQKLQAQLVLANKESSANVENALNHYSRAKQAEAQVDAVRGEYLNHVKATKTPVMVLDAVGWILERSKSHE